MAVAEYIRKIPKQNAFLFGVIGIVSLFFTTRIVPVTIQHLAGALLALILVFLLEDRDRTDIGNFNKEFEVKLSKITPLPEFFHIDVDIIDLFDNISEFKEYNPETWIDLVNATDKVLSLRSDMDKGVAQCVENIQAARMFKTNAVNHMHSFIFSLPSSVVLDQKLKSNLDRLDLLLRRHIDDMVRTCRKQKKLAGPSTATSRPLLNHGPRPNDLETPGISQFDYYV